MADSLSLLRPLFNVSSSQRPSLTPYLKSLPPCTFLSVPITSPPRTVFGAHHPADKNDLPQFFLPAFGLLLMLIAVSTAFLLFSSGSYFSTFRSRLWSPPQKGLPWSPNTIDACHHHLTCYHLSHYWPCLSFRTSPAICNINGPLLFLSPDTSLQLCSPLGLSKRAS